jgi:hypothetical protein
MSAGRTISLLAWAAIIAAWAAATPQRTTAEDIPSDVVVQHIEEHKEAHPIEPGHAEFVDHLGEELGPEDYAALANPNLPGLLPPVEFSHPYRGKLVLLRGQNQKALRRICGKKPEGVLLGCARKPDTSGVPFVVLADEATVRANGWTPNLNALHEAGHLNGAWTHDGWRDLARLGAPPSASLRPVATPAPMPEGKAIIVAQADAVPDDEPGWQDEPPPPPRRHPRPPRYYGPPVYGPPPGWIVIPSEQRAMPCLPMLVGLRFCI